MSRPTIVTVGTFDGVHAGHRLVVQTLLAEGKRRGLEPLVLTFDKHPLQVIAPLRAPKLLCTTVEKMQLLGEVPVPAECLNFTPEMQHLSARQWMQRLVERYNAAAIVLGHDNTFGHDGRSLTVADYEALGEEFGVEVVKAPVLEGVSSSAIRKALINGDLARANAALGREFSLEGRVVHGHHVGRTLGFPTANLAVEKGLQVPANGVYAVTAHVDGESRPALVNIGVRPTIGNGAERTVECHIPGYDGQLYDRRLRIDFRKRLRGERQFESLEELQQAIRTDLAALEGL